MSSADRPADRTRPNIVLVLADDLGYSDLGCYGGEISTPHLDRLARDGARLTQFYNTARCSPSRASLLTGLHPHQTGVGILTTDQRPEGYAGSLNDQCATIAELLNSAGYSTGLSGKWHLTNDPYHPNDAWPTRRGFEHFFGTLNGCGSFYDPRTLTRGEENVESEARNTDFYYTDAITDDAIEFIRKSAGSTKARPFFSFVSYTAPHFPLHAPEEDIRRYEGSFDDGWDALRERRMERLRELELMPAGTPLSDRDPSQPAWDDAPDKEWQARRMQVYAAQVERMDAGIGRIIETLEQMGCLDETIVIFLSDNGAEAVALPVGDADRFRERTDILRQRTRDGRPVAIGNDPLIVPGGEDTYASYGQAWANLSNTPFRYYKKWVHEGGIASPFIMRWPDGHVPPGRIVPNPFQLTDVVPSILEAAGVGYPSHSRDHKIFPLEGRTMLPALRGDGQVEHANLYWEHCGNAAIRSGRWKLVRAYPGDWELYDIENDRTELTDVASHHPEIVADLSSSWQLWAEKVGVVPFETTVAIYRDMGLDDESAWSCALGEGAP